MCTVLQVPYRLHAVLVHEGQANAGHYWAYIYDPQHGCWMKYNDISVTKSSWEELVRDSFGGYRNASAYCLMYINDKKPFLVQGNYTITYAASHNNLIIPFSYYKCALVREVLFITTSLFI